MHDEVAQTEHLHVLVTGGAGFIGSHIVDRLLRLGHTPVVLDDFSTGSERNVAPGVSVLRGDITDSAFLASALADTKFDSIIHAAAEASVVRSMADRPRSWRINVQGTRNIAELAQTMGVTSLVFLSSGGAVYGETPECATEEARLAPISAYGEQKAEAEAVLRHLPTAHRILRPANVYGPRQRGDVEGGVIAIFRDSYSQGWPLLVYGDGSAARDYVYVADVAEAAVTAAVWPSSGTWNIGTGVATTLNELLALIAVTVGPPPAGVNWLPARQGELSRACVDPSHAGRDGFWRPTTSLAHGLQLTLSHLSTRSATARHLNTPGGFVAR